ncbi:MAG: MraY family glycosyltransferase [Phycisphaerae bacterium]
MLPVALTALIGSFFVSLIATYVVRQAALKRGFVDRPGGHKQHESPVALGGGIAITWTVCLPVLAGVLAARAAVHFGVPDWLPEFVKIHVGGVALKAPEAVAIVGGALLLHVVGLIDDVRPIRPAGKLVAQAVVALILSGIFGIRLLDMAVLPGWVSVMLTVVWIVAVTNAFNFLDNMDGLSAGVAVLAAMIFALAALGSGQVFVPVMLLLLIGALVGFLVFNFPPATIFMGDAGSTVIGYLMAVLIVLTTFYNPEQRLKPAGVLLPIVVLAIPLYDVATVIVHRILAGTSIFQGDQRHFSHRLLERGLSRRAALFTIYLATAATSLTAVLLPHVDWPAAVLIFSQCLCVVLIIAILEHTPSRR